MLGRTVGLASAPEMATTTKRNAIRRRAAAVARWFTICECCRFNRASRYILCTSIELELYALLLGWFGVAKSCFTPSYSLANAIADKMYVVVRDESMDG